MDVLNCKLIDNVESNDKNFDEYFSRLSTYGTWPATAPTQIKAMVETGLVYTGVSDTVFCYRCGELFSGWSDYDEPKLRHLQRNPTCPYLTNQEKSTVKDIYYWDKNKERVLKKNFNDSMSTEEKRYDSFAMCSPQKDWPSPPRLAQSGFYYDIVKEKMFCFSCGLQVGSWDCYEQNPDLKHHELSKDCPFILNKLGQRSSPEISSGQFKSLNSDMDLLDGEKLDAHIESLFDNGEPVKSKYEVDYNEITPVDQNDYRPQHQPLYPPSKNQQSYDSTGISHNPSPNYLLNQAPPHPVRPYSHPGQQFYLPPQHYQPSMRFEQPQQRVVPHQSSGVPFQSTYDANISSGSYDYLSSNYNPNNDNDRCLSLESHFSSVIRSPEDDLQSYPPTTSRNLCVVAPAPKPDYRSYHNRIVTFFSFPKTCPVSAMSLAEAGFYYTQVGDRVTCYMCNTKLEIFERGDTAWGQHCKWSPSCPLVAQQQQPPVFPPQRNNFSAPPPRVEYPNFYDRQNFTRPQMSHNPAMFSRNSQMPPQPRHPGVMHPSVLPIDRLSLGPTDGIDGYADNLSDRCNSIPRPDTFSNHKPPDDPYNTLYKKPEPYASPNQLNNYDNEVCHAKEFDNDIPDEDGVTDPKLLEMKRKCISDKDLQEILDMGYTEELVLKTLQCYTRYSKRGFKKVDDIVQAVMYFARHNDLEGTPYGEALNVEVSEDGREMMTPSDSTDFTLQNNNNNGKTNNLCKICMDNDVEVTFIPCGHCMSCASCALGHKFCFICREEIKKTFRTFLS